MHGVGEANQGGGARAIQGTAQAIQGAGAPPSGLAGHSTTVISRDFGVKNGGQGVKMKEETIQKAHAAFIEFKTLLVEKLVVENQMQRPINFDATLVKIDFSTKLATVTLETGACIYVHLTHLSDRSNSLTLDSQVAHAAKNFEGVLTSENLINSSEYSEVDRANENVLGDYKGLNGLQEAYKGIQEGCKKKIIQENQVALVDSFCIFTGITDPSGETSAIINKYSKILGEHEEMRAMLKIERNALKDHLTVEIAKDPKTITNQQIEECKTDIKAFDEKIRNTNLTKEDKRTLLLTLTVEHLNEKRFPQNRPKPPRERQVEEMKKTIEAFFELKLKIGESKIDPKTKRLVVKLTKPYKEYATFIAAAAVFSRHSSIGHPPREYRQELQREYQTYLTKEKIDPRNHLGNIGALLRLEGDTTLANSDGIDRNLENLYFPQTLSFITENNVTRKLEEAKRNRLGAPPSP